MKLKPKGRMIASISRDGETSVTHYRNARALAFTAALLMAAIALIPRPVSSDLGAGWKCSQNVLMTSCRLAQQ